MRTLRRLAIGTAGLALGAGTALGAAGNAQAAAPSPDGASLQGGTAPACIVRGDYTPGDLPWFSVTNECGKTMRVKIIINNGDDSGCESLDNYETMTHYFVGGRYDRTVVC
jgi:hypothetical protein